MALVLVNDGGEPGSERMEVPLLTCPIASSLRVLGRKWALLILRDVGMHSLNRFNQILHNNDGLTPRILSMRLQELREEGYLERIVDSQDERDVRYVLTDKGADLMPVLRAFISFGVKHHAREVFPDGRQPSLENRRAVTRLVDHRSNDPLVPHYLFR